MWVATVKLPKSPGHPFYTQLNALLEAEDFDRFVEGQCAQVLRAGDGTAEPRARAVLPVAAWSATLKGSSRNAGSPGARATRWQCAVFCGCRWRRRPRIIRRFRVRGALSTSKPTARSSLGC